METVKYIMLRLSQIMIALCAIRYCKNWWDQTHDGSGILAIFVAVIILFVTYKVGEFFNHRFHRYDASTDEYENIADEYGTQRDRFEQDKIERRK